MKKHIKPPLGLIPYKFWIAQRIQSILDAIVRYSDAEKEIPIEWIQEYREHVKYINEEE